MPDKYEAQVNLRSGLKMRDWVQKNFSFTMSSWLGLVFSLAVIAYVFATLDWLTVTKTFSQLNAGILLLAFFVYLINYLLRTWRFRILLKLDTVSFGQLFGLTSLYGMYLYLLPAKSGEATYPLMLKTWLGVTLTQGTATLIVARFLDFATVALFLPLVLIPFWGQIHSVIRWGALFFVLLIVIVSIFGLGFVRRPMIWQGWLHSPTSLPGRIKSILGKLLTRVAEIDRQGQYWLISLVTMGIWICVQANFYLILWSLGYSLTIYEIAVITIIMVPMTLLPLQGFANIGTHEVGWTAAFALFGYPQTTALAIAISTHIILLASVLTLGAIGHFTLIFLQKKQ